MCKAKAIRCATTAVLTLAEIKAEVEAFDRGKTNVHDALEAILVALAAYQAAARAARDAA